MAEITDSSDKRVVDFHDDKMHQIFIWFDQNGDGALTEDDFEKSADLFCALATEDDQANRASMRDGLMKWWRLLLDTREDKNASERIGRDEYVSIMKHIMLTPEVFQTTIRCTAEGMLRALDTDKNGTLSADEYVQLYSRLGVGPERLGVHQEASLEAFKKIDRDSDGQITDDELLQAITEFFTSSDPDAPGQWLIGPPASFH